MACWALLLLRLRFGLLGMLLLLRLRFGLLGMLLATSASEIDRLKRENETQLAASQAPLDNAAKQTAQLQADKAELRTQLLTQFNAILQTRDTARGLIVNMSDVLFDTGKYSLRPLAREKLSKWPASYPGIRV